MAEVATTAPNANLTALIPSALTLQAVRKSQPPSEDAQCPRIKNHELIDRPPCTCRPRSIGFDQPIVEPFVDPAARGLR